MPADASIYGQIQPVRPRNMLADAAGVMQIQGMQQQAAMGQMKMDEFRRSREQENALSSAYSRAVRPDGTMDRNALVSGVAQAGLGAKIPGIQEGFAKSDKATTDADQAKFKLATERYDFYKKTLGALAQEPNLSKDLVTQAGQALVQHGILPAAMYEQSIASMPDDPQQLRARLVQGVKSQLTPEQMFTVFAPKAEKIDSGSQISFRDTNPNSPTFGQQVAGAAVAKEQSPDNKASVAASRENAAATRAVAAATRDAAKIGADKDREMKLGDDWRAQSKPFKEVADAYKIITASLDKATASPAATLAGATKFMKLLDPGSVVRESELGMALAAAGVFDRAANYVNTLKRGKVLTEQQAADFKTIAGQIYGAAQEGQKQVDANYTRQASAYGLRPDLIVQDLGQNTALPVDLGTLPSGGKPAAGGSKVVDFGSLK